MDLLNDVSRMRAPARVLSWLVEFATVLVNRCEVGHDGKTLHERLRGKQSRLLGLDSGSCCMFEGIVRQGNNQSWM